ncbi:MAG: hypothetical protein IT342_00700 [Candidatus Melainabacteria bacterium]|nr:hypothetical protein [Candidatus Melainabacteria bacterium]
MHRFIAHTNIKVEHNNSILAFERPPTSNWPNGWDRYLTVEGKPAFHIGNICGTCAFLFERLEGANQKISARQISEQLQAGLIDIPGELLDAVTELVPQGEYVASLLEVHPHKIVLGATDDYFASEQIDLFGGLPHYPKIEYYRSLTTLLGDDRALFEFLVPMYPDTWLQKEQVQLYRQSISSGRRPTALAISILDIKQPADWDEGTKVTEHWCLAHYLMDGHHKVFAAAQEGSPMTLLSLLCLGECIASKEDIDKALEALACEPTR